MPVFDCIWKVPCKPTLAVFGSGIRGGGPSCGSGKLGVQGESYPSDSVAKNTQLRDNDEAIVHLQISLNRLGLDMDIEILNKVKIPRFWVYRCAWTHSGI